MRDLGEARQKQNTRVNTIPAASAIHAAGLGNDPFSTRNSTRYTVYDRVCYTPLGRFSKLSSISRQPRGRQHRTVRRQKALGETLPRPTFSAPKLFQLSRYRPWKVGSGGGWCYITPSSTVYAGFGREFFDPLSGGIFLVSLNTAVRADFNDTCLAENLPNFNMKTFSCQKSTKNLSKRFLGIFPILLVGEIMENNICVDTRSHPLDRTASLSLQSFKANLAPWGHSETILVADPRKRGYATQPTSVCLHTHI